MAPRYKPSIYKNVLLKKILIIIIILHKYIIIIGTYIIYTYNIM